MSSNIIKADNGASSGITGIVQTAGSDGTLLLQTTTSGGTATTAMTINNSQVVTFANQLTAASMPTGSVVQVIQSTYSSTGSNSTTTFANTGLAVTITPQFSTSKILIFTNLMGVFSGGATGIFAFQQILRGATVIVGFDHISGYVSSANGGSNSAFMYLDSPSTTSPTTYTLQICRNGSSGNINWNNDSQTSTMTAMEII